MDGGIIGLLSLATMFVMGLIVGAISYRIAYPSFHDIIDSVEAQVHWINNMNALLDIMDQFNSNEKETISKFLSDFDKLINQERENQITDQKN